LSPGSTSARLLISCADRPGIVAAVAGFLRDAGANIVHSDQHSTDPEGGRFFMRMEFVLPLAEGERGAFERAFARDVGDPLGLDWRVWYVADRKRMGILVSRTDHCLLDLLWRWRRGEFEADVVAVASNHPDLRADVDAFALPYHHVPVDRADKAPAEARLLELLGGIVDVVVLARYMQVLSDDLCKQLEGRAINIHHSFLPSFKGAKPYHQAYDRGVKLIGATAHYVTHDLDEGPIIEQIVERVDHGSTPDMLVSAGRDSERRALSAAVRYAIEHRVFLNGTRTVVFK